LLDYEREKREGLNILDEEYLISSRKKR